MRSEAKVSTARKLSLLFLTLRNPLRTISMLPVKNRNDRPEAKQKRNSTSKRTRRRETCRERWLRKYYSLSLLGWLTKPLSPLQSEYSDDETDSNSPSPKPSPQKLSVENESGSMESAEATSDQKLDTASTHLFTETALPQVESDNTSLILSAEESDDRLPSHYLSDMIQRDRKSQMCIDPKNLTVPYTPITVEERLAGTDEIHTTVINTCGMTNLPYTLHDDDPFDTKYPNPNTLLPPISTFLSSRPERQS